MSLYKFCAFFVWSLIYIYAPVCIDGANVTISDAVYTAEELIPAAVVNSPVFKPAVDSFLSVNLLSSFPEDLEISEYCSELLHIFGQRYVAYVNCLVPAARPVKVCLNCFSGYGNLMVTYMNISSDQVRSKNKALCVFELAVDCLQALLVRSRLTSHESCDVTYWW